MAFYRGLFSMIHSLPWGHNTAMGVQVVGLLAGNRAWVCLFFGSKKKHKKQHAGTSGRWGVHEALKHPRLFLLWIFSNRTGVGSSSARTSRFLLTTWTNSCYSRRRAITAGRHFRVNWLFVYASTRRHTLFTPLTEKPFMFQNWFHMLPLLSAWQCCWVATLSTGRLESGVASDAQCKYLYILSFCLCVNCRVS